MKGYDALHDFAAWMDLSGRGKIRVTGEDRVSFLHAMCSQDIEHLPAGQGIRAFFLNAQGQIQADARIFSGEDHLLLDIEPDRREPLIEHLEKFVIMDDVTLEDQHEALVTIAIEGPRADEVLRGLFEELPAAPHAHLETGGVRILRTSLTGQPGLWLLAQAGQREGLLEKLRAVDLPEATADDARIVRVENQTPCCGEDYGSSNLPQETQLHDFYSFTKGCYLGQEIVERVRSRGQVRRALAGLTLETREAPPNSDVTFQDKPVGKLTSPVFSPRLQKVAGFAILRREAAEPGTKVRVAGVTGHVREAGKSEV